MQALDSMKVFAEAEQDRHGAAKALRTAGGKVVGYHCDNVPVELIRAAGLTPFRLYGDSNSARTVVADRLSPFHARRFAGPEFVDAVFSQFAAGELDFVDYLVTPHNRKAVPALIQSLYNLKRYRPETRVPECYFLDRTYTDTFISERYNRDAIGQLKAKLEDWAGAPIAAERLAEEIALANANRALLARFGTFRDAAAPRISGTDALRVYAASHYMAPDALNSALAALIAELEAAPVLPGTPVFLGGSPWDHGALYRAIEDAGAIVVAEDHCWGARCADAMIGDAAPMDAVAIRYAFQPACSIRGSINKTIAATLNRARASGAQAAIFAVIRGDDVQMWETPSEIAALEAEGIACLHLPATPYSQGEIDVTEQVRAFVQAQGKEARA